MTILVVTTVAIWVVVAVLVVATRGQISYETQVDVALTPTAEQSSEAQ